MCVVCTHHISYYVRAGAGAIYSLWTICAMCAIVLCAVTYVAVVVSHLASRVVLRVALWCRCRLWTLYRRRCVVRLSCIACRCTCI